MSYSPPYAFSSLGEGAAHELPQVPYMPNSDGEIDFPVLTPQSEVWNLQSGIHAIFGGDPAHLRTNKRSPVLIGEVGHLVDCGECENPAPENDVDTSVSFLNPVRMPDNEPVLILDMGSIGNLGGDHWAADLAETAIANGLKPTYTRRQRPLEVSGVGKGSERCTIDSQLPVELVNSDGKHVSGGLTMPIIPNSYLPGLLGLTGMKNNRTIIDTNDNKIYFLGPGGYDLSKALPPGTECFQAKIAPTGHMVLPCAQFSGKKESPELTLHIGSLREPGPVASSGAAPSQPPVFPTSFVPVPEPSTPPPSSSAE